MLFAIFNLQYFKSGAGPLLIYLPGMEGSGRLFYKQEPSLAERFTVVALPSRSIAPFTYQDLVDDVLNRTQTADDQARTFLAMELALRAEHDAKRIERPPQG